MLAKYFKMWEGGLGRSEETENRIDLRFDANPVQHIPYNEGLDVKEKKEKFVKEQLLEGLIELTTLD